MTADTIGGVWTYALELSRALARHHVEIALATMGAPLNRSQRAEVASLRNVKIFESDYKLEWMNEPWKDMDRAGDWLLELEDQFQPDIVHLNNFSHGALPWRAPKIVVGHSCVLSWWRATKACEAPPEWNVYRTRVTEGLALADCVVAPSRSMLNALEEHYGPFAASAVIPNGRQSWKPQSRSKEDLILGAGRLWDEAKNVGALANLASDLLWPVYLAGENRHPDGRQRDYSHVRYLSYLSQRELQTWFDRSAIFAAPARYEPFGLSILEAALAGCAMVLGDIPSLRENWNRAALFVPPNDPDALKTALRELIRNATLRGELSAKSQAIASQFTPGKMAENYLKIYSDIVAKLHRGDNEMIRVLPVGQKETAFL